MKKIIIIILCISLILIDGCEANSSYSDCNFDCHGLYRNESNSNVGTTDLFYQASEELNRFCYNECKNT